MCRPKAKKAHTESNTGWAMRLESPLWWSSVPKGLQTRVFGNFPLALECLGRRPAKLVDYFRLLFAYTESHVPRTGKLQARGGSV